MKIIADTATLFSPDEGRDMGITVIPVCVAINDRTYKDYEEISSEEFLRLISEGGVPTSSQPSVGDVLEVLENCSEETLFLTVGDGLSGAYQTAIGAKNCIENNGHIHIIDSQTLAGPMRYLAKKAVALKQQGISLQEIKASLLHSIETSVSFVIPEDFEFLKRSGRLTAITAKVGGVLKLLPVLTQTEDRKRIKPLAIKRSWRAAVDTIIQRMQTIGMYNFIFFPPKICMCLIAYMFLVCKLSAITAHLYGSANALPYHIYCYVNMSPWDTPSVCVLVSGSPVREVGYTHALRNATPTYRSHSYYCPRLMHSIIVQINVSLIVMKINSSLYRFLKRLF